MKYRQHLHYWYVLDETNITVSRRILNQTYHITWPFHLLAEFGSIIKYYYGKIT